MWKRRGIIGLALFLGLTYGYLSSRLNVPYEFKAGQAIHVGDWQPSPLWFPSYVLARAQLYLVETRSGWTFRFDYCENYYRIASTTFGAVLFLIAAYTWMWINKKNQYNKRMNADQ